MWSVCTNTTCMRSGNTIGHLQVTLHLCFKTSPHAKSFISKWVWFAWHENSLCSRHTKEWGWGSRKRIWQNKLWSSGGGKGGKERVPLPPLPLCFYFAQILFLLPSSLPFIGLLRRLHENEPVGQTHFHMDDFRRRLMLTQRQKATRKWLISQRCSSRKYPYSLYMRDWNYLGVVCKTKNLKKCTKLNWNLGCPRKIPSTGEVWVLSGATQCCSVKGVGLNEPMIKHPPKQYNNKKIINFQTFSTHLIPPLKKQPTSGMSNINPIHAWQKSHIITSPLLSPHPPNRVLPPFFLFLFIFFLRTQHCSVYFMVMFNC